MARGGPASRLLGRDAERRQLDGILAEVRGGQSRVIVVRGEPGIGKTALLDYAVDSAAAFTVARVSGVESEMELPYAALHQLCAPMLDRLAMLPEPQRDAASTAFGLRTGRRPDRFLVGLAVLTLLSEVARKARLMCVVDDAQWVDRESTLALAFVARRLWAERVALLFATREPASPAFNGLPELSVEGLGQTDAHSLLASVLPVPLDNRVRDRIISEARGNPLALLEWTRGLTPAELAGGFGLPPLMPISHQIEESFRRRLAELPPATRLFLTVAAAEPTGTTAVVWGASGRLAIDTAEASAAVETGLVEVGTSVTFRHPLVRSAVYRMASVSERRSVHRALSEATDPNSDSVRRAWHLALAASDPDEGVAAELERSAGQAEARGGLAAAAALLERSVALTPDPASRAQRALAAARAALEAGDVETSARLVSTAASGPLDELGRAMVDRVSGWQAHALGDARHVPDLLLQAAKRLEPLHAEAARDTYLEALASACEVGSLGPDGIMRRVATAARGAPPALDLTRPRDLLLDGESVMVTEGLAVAAPVLERARAAFLNEETSADEAVRWGGFACVPPGTLWDYETDLVFARRWVQVTRDLGALTLLPTALNAMAMMHLFKGNLAAAEAALGEAEAINEATGLNSALYASSWLAAVRGREGDAVRSIETTIKIAQAGGRGLALTSSLWARATLYNGLGRYDKAFVAAREAVQHPPEWSFHLMYHELIEAAVRNDKPAVAAATFDRLLETSCASGSAWALGVLARSHALLSSGETAESLYREGIDRLGSTPLRSELARAHLLYGEWLRREGRKPDARKHLRAAHDLFTAIGAEAFAERARIELRATGTTAPKPAVGADRNLTPQEARVSRLAAEGNTNAEIAARLFLSPSTVDYHLRKAFRKLGIRSRTQLARRLAS